MSSNAKLSMSLDKVIEMERKKNDHSNKQAKGSARNSGQPNNKDKQQDGRKRGSGQVDQYPNKRQHQGNAPQQGSVQHTKQLQQHQQKHGNQGRNTWNNNSNKQFNNQGNQGHGNWQGNYGNQQVAQQQQYSARAKNRPQGQKHNPQAHGRQPVQIPFAGNTVLEGAYIADDEYGQEVGAYLYPGDNYGNTYLDTGNANPYVPAAYDNPYASAAAHDNPYVNAAAYDDPYTTAAAYDNPYTNATHGNPYANAMDNLGRLAGRPAYNPLPQHDLNSVPGVGEGMAIPRPGKTRRQSPPFGPMRGRTYRSRSPRRRHSSRSPGASPTRSPAYRRPHSRSPPARRSRSPPARRSRSPLRRRSLSPPTNTRARAPASGAANNSTRTIPSSTLPPRANGPVSKKPLPTSTTNTSHRGTASAPSSRSNPSAPSNKDSSSRNPSHTSNQPLSSKQPLPTRKHNPIAYPQPGTRHTTGRSGAGTSSAATHSPTLDAQPPSPAEEREYSPDRDEEEERAVAAAAGLAADPWPMDPRRGGSTHRALPLGAADPQGEIFEDGGFIAPPTLYRQGVQEAGDDLISLKTVLRPDSGVLARQDVPLTDVAAAVLGINTVLTRDAVAAGEQPTVLSLRHMQRLKERMEMGEVPAAADTLRTKGAHHQAILILSQPIVALAAQARQMTNLLEYGRDIRLATEPFRRQYEFILHQLKNNLDWSEIFEEVPQFYSLSKQDQQTVLENLQKRREARAADEARQQAEAAQLVAARIMGAPTAASGQPK